MSKMSELATALDEMTEVGRTLITCGENLLKAAAHVLYGGYARCGRGTHAGD